LKFLKKGISTNFKNLGQNGLRHLGVNPSGVMDRLSARLLNVSLQNDENEQVLEMYFPAPEILFEEDCTIAIGGADFDPTINNQPITNWKVFEVKAGSRLKFKKKLCGNITYLAVSPRKVVQVYLGTVRQVSSLSACTEIRFIKGNEYQYLEKNSKQTLENQGFTILNDSNRMGFRLMSEPLELETKFELVSSAVDFGTIQLLPNGQIIILMADHQTSGGYPRIGNIISVDLPKLAQCSIGDKIMLQAITVTQAEELIISQEKELRKLKASIRFFNEK
jgi:antagonist of KipI